MQTSQTVSEPLGRSIQAAEQKGLYSPQNEHDACGVGFVANVKGRVSHKTIEDALLILRNLDHRGAVGADPLCGDGAGILIQIPDAYYREEMKKQGVKLPSPGDYGVGMIFLPQEAASRAACEEELERTVRREGQIVLGWRDVPVNRAIPMSETVKQSEPVIRQIFIGRGPDVMVQDALERKLYVIRKSASHRIQALKLKHGSEYFVPSMSTRTVVYKGLLLAGQVGEYFLDLKSEEVKSAIAVVHQRFSTNTFPAWALAHPYRYIAHNGEINTVKGNYNWICARENTWKSPVLGDDVKKLVPLIYEGQSDTASLDNALEILVMSGYSLSQAVTMLVPEAWEKSTLMDPDRQAFYAYYAPMMEPWDGPAAIVFTDGVQIGATLDRNGLRPARFMLTDDDTVILASEAGTVPVPESRIKKKWRIEPGKMLLIDTVQGRIIDDAEVKNQIALAKPYREWVERLNLRLSDLSADHEAAGSEAVPHDRLFELQKAFALTQEDINLILKPMAQKGMEPVGSMGSDTALPVLSKRDQSLFDYFKQLFAQVTNPPIDPIREELVTSLVSFIGPKPNLLDVNNVNPPRRIEVMQPVLMERDMGKLHAIADYTEGKFKSKVIDITYPVSWGSAGVEACIAGLCAQAVDAIDSGFNILIVSDRAVCRDRVAIPVLLAVSALHQHLINVGLRTNVGLVVDSGDVIETQDVALLMGYGAEAVHPYLALATLRDEAALIGSSADEAVAHYVKALGKGLTKVMAKMGICSLMSYRGARIFEAVGLKSEFVARYFPGTPSRVEGIGLFEVMQEAVNKHRAAYGVNPGMVKELATGGQYAWRADGEEHMWTPEAIVKLQSATREKNYATYREYAAIVNDQGKRQMTLRGLLDFKKTGKAIPLDAVEPAKEIVKRFAGGAMSLGAISAEAHAVLAVAMNRIGGKSNTGEGGEDPRRYEEELRTGKPPVKGGQTVADILGHDRIVADIPLEAGDSLRSRIKQVASGRFGVTEQYLVSADQIQIKMAQGAKPGEGGQLPGHKVSEYIAELRYSIPGVGLISPPPHHDIYSIEDLAQLIHDLKNANSAAEISVKLVAETGVGTVAAGVAKAKADHIVISGHDGGTGASPISSVKHAGSCWELGLAETQQTLVLNHLRDRVIVQVDGQIKTGRDVVIAALLGADEFGFATAPLVVEGCLMMRQCHLNTCPVGIATQDPVLRKRFKGRPSSLVNYFFFVAEEVREIMAQLGVAKFEDLIGRTDLLEQVRVKDNPKAAGVDLSRVLYRAPGTELESRHSACQDHKLGAALDAKLLPELTPAIEKGERTALTREICNVNRTVGTQISAAITKKYGARGLPEDTVHLEFHGTAGQSFAAFACRGMTLDLVGEANDYVGKGLSGARVIVRAPAEFHGKRSENIIAGNTTLYGATSGEAYFSGVAGERFAVRLSGAEAVVEGTGDHGCEYMTGGTVVVLGKTGRNFASGMSGGVAFVFDEDGDFEAHCNTEMVALERVVSTEEQLRMSARETWHLAQSDEELLKRLIGNHVKYTGSALGEELLAHWASSRARFVKVIPLQYRAVLQSRAAKN